MLMTMALKPADWRGVGESGALRGGLIPSVSLHRPIAEAWVSQGRWEGGSVARRLLNFQFWLHSPVGIGRSRYWLQSDWLQSVLVAVGLVAVGIGCSRYWPQSVLLQSVLVAIVSIMVQWLRCPTSDPVAVSSRPGSAHCLTRVL